MSDSDGSPFEGFTEAEVRHIPPTQAVDSASIVVSPVRSTGLEPHLRTPSSSRQASIASTPAHARHSRSHSRAPGLSDQIRQILRAELRRGSDRCRRSSSYSRSTPSPPLGLIAVSPPAGTAITHVPVVCPVVPVRHVLIVRSVTRPVDTHATLTPIVGVTAHTRACLDAVMILVITACHVVHHTSSTLARFRVLRVPSRWPLRRPRGQSRPPRSPPLCFYGLRCRLLVPRLLRDTYQGSLSL